MADRLECLAYALMSGVGLGCALSIGWTPIAIIDAGFMGYFAWAAATLPSDGAR
jgi:hypothetical protein